jgi:hypothetical protein
MTDIQDDKSMEIREYDQAGTLMATYLASNGQAVEVKVGTPALLDIFRRLIF